MRRILVPPPSGAVEPGPAPTFTVVIAAYQAGATVAVAVESTLAQTEAAAAPRSAARLLAGRADSRRLTRPSRAVDGP